MPPNATHLCQPLDVAVFRGLKQSWRSILLKWRVESRIKGAIPKEHLPTILNKLNNTLRSEALISGFRATGIYPMDKTEVIKRLPGKYKDPGGKDTVMILKESVLDILKNNLGLGANPPAKRKPRGPKVEPGKRIH